MKIFLIDNTITGHHDTYEKALNRIKNTQIENIIVNFVSVKKNFLKAFSTRRNFIKKIASGKENIIIHLLYIDSLYKCPMIHLVLDNKKNKYIGTLHWVPKEKFNQVMLKKFSERLEYVIVHSEYLKYKMNEIGIQNVECIDYPSFIDNNKINYEIDNKKIIISCLGGTRSDKGLDILMEAFKSIDDNKKNELVFNICGIEQDIKYKHLEDEARKNNINVICKNKFLSDEEYENEIVSSDVILLPYKKIFTGNSGPMTDGVYMNKYILGPDEGNLGYLIKKHNLGSTFKQEDPQDLAKRISELNKQDLFKEHKYRQNISLEKFLKSHKTLYRKIEKDNS